MDPGTAQRRGTQRAGQGGRVLTQGASGLRAAPPPLKGALNIAGLREGLLRIVLAFGVVGSGPTYAGAAHPREAHMIPEPWTFALAFVVTPAVVLALG